MRKRPAIFQTTAHEIVDAVYKAKSDLSAAAFDLLRSSSNTTPQPLCNLASALAWADEAARDIAKIRARLRTELERATRRESNSENSVNSVQAP